MANNLAAIHEKMNTELRQDSGEVTSSDPFVSFLYLLMRNEHMSAGGIEAALREVILDNGSDQKFTNGFLAAYAKNIVARLRAIPRAE